MFDEMRKIYYRTVLLVAGMIFGASDGLWILGLTVLAATAFAFGLFEKFEQWCWHLDRVHTRADGWAEGYAAAKRGVAYNPYRPGQKGNRS